MTIETFFKNEGPMGNDHAHLRVFKTSYSNKMDITIINRPGTDDEKNSFNVVLDNDQVKQLRRVLAGEVASLPPANIFTKGD